MVPADLKTFTHEPISAADRFDFAVDELSVIGGHVQMMLDAVVNFLPSPLDKGAVKGTDPKTGSELERTPSDDQPFSALAFKIATDPFVGRLVVAGPGQDRADVGSGARFGRTERTQQRLLRRAEHLG